MYLANSVANPLSRRRASDADTLTSSVSPLGSGIIRILHPRPIDPETGHFDFFAACVLGRLDATTDCRDADGTARPSNPRTVTTGPAPNRLRRARNKVPTANR